MVVLLPLRLEEQLRCCTSCHQLGLRSPVLERSNFYMASRRTGQWRSVCRRCDLQAAAAKELARKRRDPEFRRRRQEQDRAYRARNREETRRRQRERARERRRSDPEFLRKGREAQRRYRQRIYDDPERREEFRELRRIDDRLRREREGRSLPTALEVRSPATTWRQPLPIGPFRAWVLGLQEAEARAEDGRSDPQEAVAERLDVTPRRIRCWLRQEMIDASVVERTTTREGSITARDLYPGEF